MRASERDRSRRPWIEASILILLLFATAAFAISILDNQAAWSDDRVGLMSLRESWSGVAAEYGLRGSVSASTADFMDEYSLFKSRPSVRHLVEADPDFADSSARVDAALARLESADSLGAAAAGPRLARDAAILDHALENMASRIVAYSRARLAAARVWLGILVLLLGAVATAFVMLERRVLLQSAEGAGNRALAQALITAQEAERLRVSHELHDAVAQNLAAAKLYCGLAAAREKAESAREGDAERAVSLLERSIGEVREICQNLRPAELDRLGVCEACSELCAEQARASGLSISFSAEGFETAEVSEELGINIYRILQEALTNVRRHAKAHNVEVRLAARTVSIRLNVKDDGVGVGAAQVGLGRRGMEERARMLGGGIEVTSPPGGGTLVSAWFIRLAKE
jgi:signal transduction histidine kinase